MRTLAAWALASVLLAACGTATEPGAVGVKRPQFLLVPSEQVNQSAEKAYQQVLAEAKAKGALDRDPAQVQRMKTIIGRLIPQTAAFRKDAPAWQWEAHLLSSPEVNAWCMPGGKIAVYSGLIEKIQPADAELAAVIGHEIAHALREHSRERVSRAMTQQIALAGVAVLTGAGEGVQNMANTVAAVTFQLPHSREQESEADTIGLELMARAGFDPNAAVSVWKKMIAAEQGGTPQFLSTHPSPQSRIQDLQALVPKVTPLYQRAKS